MTREYEERLISLAEELEEYIYNNEIKDIKFKLKVYYLLGYIMALKQK